MGGGGAVSSGVSTQGNLNTQANAQGAYNSIGNFGQMPNYALGANSQYSPGIFGSTLGTNTNYDPTQLMTAGNTLQANASPVYQAGQNAYNIGADPMQSQFNYFTGQLNDQVNSGLAQRGISETPYGAAVQGQADAAFANQWQTMLAQNSAAGAGAFANAANTSSGMTAQGAGLSAQAPQLQASMLGNLLQSLAQNYAQPQANINNQLGYGQMANAENQTAINSAQQQTMANYMNSPMAFLGGLAGLGAAAVPRGTYSLGTL